ncbi:MAG: hypothetical protein ACI9MC_003570 [Kiritimatiellia bacterium]|jgi:hypothetical protein
MRSSISRLLVFGLLAACNASNGEDPAGPALLLGPVGADTFDELSVLLIDAEPEKYDFVWSLDGEAVETLAGQQAVPATETAKGDVWTVTVTKGNRVSTASITVGNSAPRAEVSIDPPSPSASDNIVATGYGVDPDNDPTFVEFAWYRNGSPSGFRGAVLDHQSTRRGDTWEVRVTAKDGDNDGPPTILSFDIVNALPYVQSVVMNTDEAKAPDTLRVTAEVVDPDGDPLTLEYEWYVNGEEGGSSDRTFSGSFGAGDKVWARVRGDDGRGAGEWVTGPVTRITNTRPTGVVASVAPAPPFAADAPDEEMDLLCAIEEVATDVDGDDIRYYVKWTVDGVPFVKGTTTTVTGDSVSFSYTNPGEHWACEVVADDDNGGLVSSTAGIDIGAKSGCVSGISVWNWDLDTMACGNGTPVSWLTATTTPGDYCDTGWELAHDDIVNTLLNARSYTDDQTYAFTSDCDGTWGTTRQSSMRSHKSCTWRTGHYKSMSEDSMVDGVVCVRSP